MASWSILVQENVCGINFNTFNDMSGQTAQLVFFDTIFKCFGGVHFQSDPCHFLPSPGVCIVDTWASFRNHGIKTLELITENGDTEGCHGDEHSLQSY